VTEEINEKNGNGSKINESYMAEEKQKARLMKVIWRNKDKGQ
jgi:hypothetical protein